MFSNTTKGTLSLLTVGFLFGLSAVIAKFFAEFLSAYQVVELRFAFAFAFLVIFMLVRRIAIYIPLNKLPEVLVFALVFVASVILFTLAIFNATVSLAVFTFYAATLIGSYILGFLFFSEQITTYKKLALATVMVALLFLANPFGGMFSLLGIIFGVFSGILQAVASMFQKRLATTVHKPSILLIQTVAGTVGAGGIVWYLGQPLIPSLPTATLTLVIFFGAIFLVISYLFLIGFKYVKLNTGSVLVSSELLFAPVFAFLLLSEAPSISTLIGGLLIILSVFFVYKADSQ